MLKITVGKITIVSLFILFLFKGTAYAQLPDLDSLLVKTIENVREKHYQQAISQANLALSIAPDYLDFHLFKGRSHQMLKQADSARWHYKYVIDKNPAYTDAFIYAISLETEQKEYLKALELADKALVHHPENREIIRKKIGLLQLLEHSETELEYLKELNKRYPDDPDYRKQLALLENSIKSDRIGLNYTLTTIDRKNAGPWHLGSLMYLRERKWGTLIGKWNYSQRRAAGELLLDGQQFEIESYLMMKNKSYSYLDIAYSNQPVFPEWRLGYSYFDALGKGWESELGLRYTKAEEQDLYSLVGGLGKYIGSYWINLRSYVTALDNTWNPAFTLTTRYYLDTRYDYLSLITGYGSSVDERSILGLIDQRLTLYSYRIGVGYYHSLGNSFLTGLQTGYNRQEYIHNEWQNEWEFILSVQYRL